MVIIFPLREKIHTLFSQQRPKYTGGRRVITLPVLPWDASYRPPVIGFGVVDKAPTLKDALPINYGLCALKLLSIPLNNLKLINKPDPSNKTKPGVVHELKPLPPKYYVISGYTYDEAGGVIPNCEVILIKTATDVGVETKYTNANGYYEFRCASPAQDFYVVAYINSNPIKVGTTVNTLNGI